MYIYIYKHQLHLLEQYSESLTNWSAIIRINTVGKSFIMKSRPGHLNQWIPYSIK